MLEFKVGWRHTYHSLLEELSTLQGGTQATAAAAAAAATAASVSARSVPEQRRLQQIASLEQQLAEIETRRAISERWTPNSEDYRAAGRKRKLLEIQRCESGLQSLFVRHHALRRQIRGTLFRERQSTLPMRNSLSSLHTKAKKLVEELQAWHAAPGPHRAQYDPASLDASSLLSGDSLPWQSGTAAANLLAVKNAEMKQLVEHRRRCLEEVGICKREAADMVRFYAHYESQLGQQLSVMQSAYVFTGHMPGGYHPDIAAVAYRSGAATILGAKLRHVCSMLDAARVLVNKLEQQHMEMPSADDVEEAMAGDLLLDDVPEDDGAAEEYLENDGEVFFDVESMDLDADFPWVMEEYEPMSP